MPRICHPHRVQLFGQNPAQTRLLVQDSGICVQLFLTDVLTRLKESGRSDFSTANTTAVTKKTAIIRFLHLQEVIFAQKFHTILLRLRIRVSDAEGAMRKWHLGSIERFPNRRPLGYQSHPCAAVSSPACTVLADSAPASHLSTSSPLPAYEIRVSHPSHYPLSQS